jgi:hypothetical protein
MFDNEIMVMIMPASDDNTMQSMLDSQTLCGNVTSSAYSIHAPVGIRQM